MRRAMRVVLGVMILFTAGVTGITAYRVGLKDGKLQAEEASLVKRPYHYGVFKAFFAERLEAEPVTWHTPDQLGVVLIRSSHPDRYSIYIVSGQEDRALDWMQKSHNPHAVKYGDEFYEILFLWVTPGFSANTLSMVFGAFLLLAVGWAIFALMVYFAHTKQTPLKQV